MREAKTAHTLQQTLATLAIPCFQNGTRALIHHHVITTTKKLWHGDTYRYAPLYALDPNLSSQLPRGLPRWTEAVVRPLRLGVYTQSFLRLISKAST